MTPRPVPAPVPCAGPECERIARTKGLCNSHYQQVGRGEKLRPLKLHNKAAPGEVCTFEGCDKAAYINGLCAPHRKQQRRHPGRELRPLRKQTPAGALCDFDGCGRVATAYGLCQSHRAQELRHVELRPVRKRERPGKASIRDEAGLKKCNGCELWLDESAFGSSRGTADGLSSKCKSCVRSRSLTSRYGVSPERFEDILRRQGGGCGICGNVDPLGRQWHVDHDHSCCPHGRSCGLCVRGLLCHRCNIGIGHFLDSRDLLLAAINYLDSNEMENSK